MKKVSWTLGFIASSTLAGSLVFAQAGVRPITPAKPATAAPSVTKPSIINPTQVAPGVPTTVNRDAKPATSSEGTKGSGTNGQAKEYSFGTKGGKTIETGLTAKEKAELSASTSNSPELVTLNTDLTELLAETAFDQDSEEVLTSFVTEEVPAWTCGTVCVTNVSEVLDEATTFASNQTEQVTAGKAFAHGLRTTGRLESAKTQCPALAPILTL